MKNNAIIHKYHFQYFSCHVDTIILLRKQNNPNKINFSMYANKMSSLITILRDNTNIKIKKNNGTIEPSAFQLFPTH